MRTVVAVLAALLLLPMSALAVPPETDPQVLALQLGDMPAGFVQMPERTKYVSNEEWAGTMANPADFLAWLGEVGRVNGYNTGYQQTGIAALIGTFAVLTSVGTYHTAEGAHAAFVERRWHNAIPVASPVVGEESQATTSTSTDPNGYALRHFVIVFRVANVATYIETIGTESTASFQDALRLAQLAASRMQ